MEFLSYELIKTSIIIIIIRQGIEKLHVGVYFVN